MRNVCIIKLFADHSQNPHCRTEDAAVVLDHLVTLEIDAHQPVRAQNPVALAEKIVRVPVAAQIVD